MILLFIVKFFLWLKNNVIEYKKKQNKYNMIIGLRIVIYKEKDKNLNIYICYSVCF